MTQERYYYKILDEAPPQPLPQTLPSTSLDSKDGFIHLSTAAQVPITADLYFQSHKTLWLLKLNISALEGKITIDDNARGCPHLHNSKLGLGCENVAEVLAIEKGDCTNWSDVISMKSLEE